MQIEETPIKDLVVITPKVFGDERGYFFEAYNKNQYIANGIEIDFVQDNQSFSYKNVLRGLHFQKPPFAQAKLVRAVAGRVLDVIVDIRKASPTYGKYLARELSADQNNLLYVPEGFAHGFQTLSDDCELIYHHSEFYKPGVENGIRFDDPLINIEWPLAPENISERDKQHSLLDKNFQGLNTSS